MSQDNHLLCQQVLKKTIREKKGNTTIEMFSKMTNRQQIQSKSRDMQDRG